MSKVLKMLGSALIGVTVGYVVATLLSALMPGCVAVFGNVLGTIIIFAAGVFSVPVIAVGVLVGAVKLGRSKR